MEQKIILDTSPEAAEQKQLTLWVSRNGRVYSEERLARYDGATHTLCACGDSVEKGRIRCSDCQIAKEKEQYLAMPEKEWDGETPLCVYGDDQYFFDADDVELFVEEHGEVQLVICEPIMARTIDPSDLYCDDLSEDGSLPEALQEAFDELNRKITAFKEPLSWSAGKFRTKYQRGENES